MQHLVRENSAKIYRQIYKHGGYFYICGDITMAEDVQDALETILKEEGGLKDRDVKNYIETMKVQGWAMEGCGPVIRNASTMKTPPFARFCLSN